MQAGGQRFESVILHPKVIVNVIVGVTGSVIDMLEQKRKLSRFLTHSRNKEQFQGMRPVSFLIWGRRKQERAHGGCLWLGKAMKGAASCEKPGGDASGL